MYLVSPSDLFDSLHSAHDFGVYGDNEMDRNSRNTVSSPNLPRTQFEVNHDVEVLIPMPLAPSYYFSYFCRSESPHQVYEVLGTGPSVSCMPSKNSTN